MAKHDDLPMDRECLDKGTVIYRGHGGDAHQIEAWVRKLAKESGQRLDWFFAIDTVVVKCLGDMNKASEAVGKLRPEYPRQHDST